MSCYISSGYTLDCRNASTGGIKEMYILGDLGNTITGWTENGNQQITSISGSGTFYQFELVKQALVSQQNVFAIILDNNNRWWSFAFQNGGLVTAGTLQTGQLYNDLNGVSALTIVGGEPNSTQEIIVPNNDLSSILVGISVG
jgi:hypothetical protein